MTDRRSALVTGVTGQDGAYLVELLLGKGYAVHGVSRHANAFDFARLKQGESARGSLRLHDLDMTDAEGVSALIGAVRPDEIYNLAAQSHVPTSMTEPERTERINAEAPIRLMEAALDLAPSTRMFQASSAELFGEAKGKAIDETSPMAPRNPYARSKHKAYLASRRLREERGLFVANGFLFNHESPFRSSAFVTRKITLAVAACCRGSREPLRLGNLDARRDWGHARDYVEGMWLALQREVPDDYVFATGENHSVREFVELAFDAAGRQVRWEGEAQAEAGFDSATGERLVEIDPAFFRPGDIEATVGDASRARTALKWRPRIDFPALVREMVLSDMESLPGGAAVNP